MALATDEHRHPVLNDKDRPALEDRLKSDAQNAVMLLREMYKLDLQIWAGRYADDEERPVIEGYRIDADARLREVKSIIQGWNGIPEDKCTPEERELMTSVRKALAACGEKRY